MARPRYSNIREELIKQYEETWSRRIQRAQRVLLESVLSRVLPKLSREDGRITITQSNFSTLTEMDRVYRDFQQTESVDLITYFIRRARNLFSTNEQYFAGVSDLAQEPFRQAIDRARSTTFTAIGYNERRDRIIRNGPLDRIFSDLRPIQVLKRIISAGISSGQEAEEMRRSVERQAIGTRPGNGVLEQHLGESMPDPFQSFDRETGVIAATELQLNYAIYQGGLVRDSRPFCIERNNKVFTREEISKFGTSADQFGGYTNKSAGEFQGKCPSIGYNPFVHLGGCNCRHQLDWISEELAVTLRPELKS